MAGLVIDASFAASLLLEEEHSAFSSSALRQAGAAARSATSLLPWEIANILRTKRRRGMLSIGQCGRVFQAFLDLEIDLAPAPDDAASFTLGQLADRYALSAYDAGYLDLAIRRNDWLATNDRNLTNAGLAAGLVVLSPFA